MISYFLVSMATKGSIFSPILATYAIITSGKLVAYSDALKHPNLHPLRLMPRPVMSLLAFHIPLDPGFLILEPMIIFLVIRIFFQGVYLAIWLGVL